MNIVYNEERGLMYRWVYLISGVIAMIFAGVIYAWSILKAPLSDEFGWLEAQLSLNYTLSMAFLCMGLMLAGMMIKKIAPRVMLIIGASLVFLGFFLTSRLSGESIISLYFCYGFLCGTGIGLSYNTIISTVGDWFPDKKGVCSGSLMMGFGFSTLILGRLSDTLFNHPDFGWRKTFLLLGVAISMVLIVTALILKKPDPNTPLPHKKAPQFSRRKDIETLEVNTRDMIRHWFFWRFYIFNVLLTVVGASMISFAREFFLTIGATPDFAVLMVGIVSICNGFARLLAGTIYDKTGHYITMLFANILAIVSPTLIIIALYSNSLGLGVFGACLAGISYGSAPAIKAPVLRDFYGDKNFATNFSVLATSAIPAAFMATINGKILSVTESYMIVFTMLLILTVFNLLISHSLRYPSSIVDK
jgi:OFA family oxalate/formate antiporter-like MFS transporter